MGFFMRNYTSEEKYDISKFMNFENDVYDVVNSPFLALLKQLPVVKYYYVDLGYHDIDLIAMSYYNDATLGYLIQYYNDDFRDTFPEGTVLKLFSLTNLEELYHTMSVKSKEETQKGS